MVLLRKSDEILDLVGSALSSQRVLESMETAHDAVPFSLDVWSEATEIMEIFVADVRSLSGTSVMVLVLKAEQLSQGKCFPITEDRREESLSVFSVNGM